MTKNSETIELIPDFPAMFQNFLRDAVNAERNVLKMGDLRKMPCYIHGWLEPDNIAKDLRTDFSNFHSWLASFVIALQAATTVAELTHLRETAAAFLTKVAEEGMRRDREEEEAPLADEDERDAEAWGDYDEGED